MSTEHDTATRSQGCYEVWTENTVVSCGWQTVMGAQLCLDGLKRVHKTPLEIFYVHRIPTADEKEAFHAAPTGRNPSKGVFLREQATGEAREEHQERREASEREKVVRDAGARSQKVEGLRDDLLRYIRELEEELSKEITVNDHTEN